jgi:hypothetical protein
MPDLITTKERFFGLRLYLDSTGEADVDEAILSLFHDHYTGSGALEISRTDSQIVLEWNKKRGKRLQAVDTGVPVKEARQGQKALFE